MSGREPHPSDQVRATRPLGCAAALALALGLTASCSERRGEPAGLDRWTFSRSTLAHGKRAGVCQPTKLVDGRAATWCFGVQPYRIAGRVAEVDLYFAGADDRAPLIEIQLKVRGCVEADLEQWMRATFGAPYEVRGARAYWRNSFLWAAALLPAEPARCLVHLLPLSEGSEIERIKLR